MKKKFGSTLVVGAGIGGIRSALDLAETGYSVLLIDKAPNLGGILRQLDYQFPTDHCGMCKMLPMIDRDASSQFCLRKGLFHENIDIMLSTELIAIEGEPGKFQVTLRSKAEIVDPEKCIGCGECSRVCPVEVPDEFNAGLSSRKAIYLPVPHNIPNHYTVDADSCTRCGECQKACPTGAIDFRLEARRSFRILVVDDEMVVRDSTKEWLEAEGFEVEMAESGMEALEKLSRSEFNLMFLDVKMPGLDGVEVLKRAREMHPTLPVVMMTAYATVETAVEAMKIGALDYITKPFDVEALIEMTVKLFQGSEKPSEFNMEVGAVVLACGFRQFEPKEGNPYGYGLLPGVVTSVEFERMISGSGPTGGTLFKEGGKTRRVAWIQCVGSRDRNHEADFCSSICCMYSIKEAVLAKEMSNGAVDAAIFYMDMRTYGKDFQAYRDRAEKEHGVRFIRSRVHSVETSGAEKELRLHYTGVDGAQLDEPFDLVVLATGQRPSEGTQALAEMAGLEFNDFGFCRSKTSSLTRTERDGILLGGSFGSPCDISESLINAGAGALAASALIHSKGGGLAVVPEAESAYRDVSRELPAVGVVLCSCGNAVSEALSLDALERSLKQAGSVGAVVRIERLCTQQGWEELQEKLKGERFNRLLIGACMPYVYNRKIKELGKAIGLDPIFIDVQDIRSPVLQGGEASKEELAESVRAVLGMGAARLVGADVSSAATIEVARSALVVGGGLAGLTAAQAIADHGFEVHLVEQAEELGGNLRKLHTTIEGYSPRELLEEIVAKVENHPKIHIYKGARVLHAEGQVGRFFTMVTTSAGARELLSHGVSILATGGREAATSSYGYGLSDSIVTQRELEEGLHAGKWTAGALSSVVMIQCVDSRVEGRDYCSRICCASALKNALHLKKENPEIEVYIFYRDIMTYGFMESYYTQARKAGVVFIQYSPESPPKVSIVDGRPEVRAKDPILAREIIFTPDLLALSVGIVPSEQTQEIAKLYGAEVNENGFIREAEYKWRPVDAAREGVFLCGIAHSPRSIKETIAMAEASAQRSLRILCRERIKGGGVGADVRRSLCSLCERCVGACPYGARRLDEEEERIVVDDAMCQGCGACAAACPNSAAFVRGYRDRQIFAVLDEAMGDF